MVNRLAGELSPYLRQHAHNPVDWYPWGAEALREARTTRRAILLSIGYSACHWCHVMEQESFDDPVIAAQMNAAFVNIKVDREERPDLDKIYQTAVQLMTRRRGGWPLTVFLTPDLKPFYGGTYFPPEDRHGTPGFASVLHSVAQAFTDRGDEVSSMADDVVDALHALEAEASPSEVAIDRDVSIRAAQALGRRFDSRYGGFGDAPKFPNTMSLDVMLRAYVRSGDEHWLSSVKQSMDAMIDGGIHDQIGGGFHRYATDARWRVPHFEKMLYDNALIARLLIDLWRLTREPRYRETCLSLLRYVEREMSATDGGFFATQDADSEGREGAFFVWTPKALEEALGARDGAFAARYYGVDEAGNFEGATTVLHRTQSIERVAEELDTSPSNARTYLDTLRQKLFDVRELRVKPFRDEKIVTSWNGLMAGAFAEAGAAFADPRLVQRAVRALEFVRDGLYGDGHLNRVSKDGVHQGRGFLSDYADVANAALDVYEASFDASWAAFAQELVDVALEKFWEPDSGSLFFAEAADDLVVRSEDHIDGEVPSSTSSMLRALLRLDAWLGQSRYVAVAERVLQRRSPAALRDPAGHGHLVAVVDRWVHGATHVMLVDGKGGPATDWARVVRATYVPNRMLVLIDGAHNGAANVLGEVPTRAGVYICRDHACAPPVDDAEALTKLLAPR
ncbi:MAG: thioredoxin domain-containing protein [Polyangiales bacterium]